MLGGVVRDVNTGDVISAKATQMQLVSISPTFYDHLFLWKCFAQLSLVKIWISNFLAKESRQKAACKLLVKLTIGRKDERNCGTVRRNQYRQCSRRMGKNILYFESFVVVHKWCHAFLAPSQLLIYYRHKIFDLAGTSLMAFPSPYSDKKIGDFRHFIINYVS